LNWRAGCYPDTPAFSPDKHTWDVRSAINKNLHFAASASILSACRWTPQYRIAFTITPSLVGA
jgi:hypothetical protein